MKFFNLLNTIKNLFLSSVNTPWLKSGNLKLSARKFLIAVEIILHIMKYLFDKIYIYIKYKLLNSKFWPENKSFIFVILTSFLLYYFIVIELSTLIFGYSLLCYRFLFIFIASLIILAWRMETQFLKKEMEKIKSFPLEFWIDYYKGQNPLSISNYLFFYKNKPLFWNVVVERYASQLHESWAFFFTFFTFFTFFYFYTCIYWFDPRFVKFIAWYFNPVINFFETWAAPWFEDFTSAIVWFRNWVFIYFETKSKKEKTTLNENLVKLKKLTRPTARLEDRASIRWTYKISLRKTQKWSDLYYLRAASLKPHSKKLAFELEIPTINASRLDPNWKILFFWFITEKYHENSGNFWKNHFFNNKFFWIFLNNYSKDINTEVNSLNNLAKKNFYKNDEFLQTPYENFFSQNYATSDSFNLNPLYESLGWNRDLFRNYTDNANIKKRTNSEAMKELFTTTAYYLRPLSITDLYTFVSTSSEVDKDFFSLETFKNTFTKTNPKQIINILQETQLKEFLTSFSYDLDVQLLSHHIFENLPSYYPDLLRKLLHQPITNKKLHNLYLWYNHWISALETQLELVSLNTNYKPEDYLTLAFVTNLINKWIDRIENVLENKGFLSFLKDQIPTSEDLKYYSRKYFRLSNFWQSSDLKIKKDGFLSKKKEWLEKERLEKEKDKIFLLNFCDEEIDDFINAEITLRSLEWKVGLWKNTINFNLDNKNTNPIQNKTLPYYMKFLDFLSDRDYKLVLPGFVWYYSATPFSSVFSTVGLTWNWYMNKQNYWRSTIVGYSDNIMSMKNTTPMPLYSGVEAILYLKPILNFFNFFLKLFLKLVTYPIELLVVQSNLPIFTSILSLTFFAHLIWFLHFYIYLMVGFYFLYYVLLFYCWKIGFIWFYEWMFEENLLSMYTNRMFWYTAADIWSNFKWPEQLLLLSIQTNVLLYYTFFDYSKFFIFNKNNFLPMVKIIIQISQQINILSNFETFQKYFYLNTKNKIPRNEYYYFWAFYYLNNTKYSSLLFEGGVDCSPDHLIWSYLEYLNHTSNFCSWALWKNIYFISWNSEISSLIWQFTILISAASTDAKFLFLSTPLQDSSLSKKLVINLFFFFKTNKLKSVKLFDSHFLYNLTLHSPLIKYIKFIEHEFNCINHTPISGLSTYSFFDSNELNSLTTSSNIQIARDDMRFWIFAFFRSFWFTSKLKVPNLNYHQSYDILRIQLGWIAYSNSWISQSTYVWPFFNIIQHLWWTSWIYTRAFDLINSSYNINLPGLNIIDQVWNFTEKWYSYKLSNKIETVFGLVRTLNFETIRLSDPYLPHENMNFDLSFSEDLINKKTTTRGFFKTNPPINVLELGITPSLLFEFFKNLPPSYVWIYLTFITQLPLLEKNFSVEEWNLANEFESLNQNLYSSKSTDVELYSKYEFFFKQFDFLLFKSSNFSKNWTFTFDTGFFFSHFNFSDYFVGLSLSSRPNNFKISNNFENSELKNLLFANLDMSADLELEKSWFHKPFGVLDRMEVHSLKKFKTVKLLDQKSFTRNWDDPFSILDWEHTVTSSGLATYPKTDPKNLLEAYEEEFSAYWDKKFPYNPTLVKNSNSSILGGWVGELYYNTINSTNFLYSLLYASPAIDISAFNSSNLTAPYCISLPYEKKTINSFFGKTSYQQQFVAKSFFWLNLVLNPFSYRYSYGPKAAARLDYWSWKCGFMLDYKNGLYTFWPYQPLWHSFGTRLIPYDNTYGFYWTYRQIDDNPLIIDLNTDAPEKLSPSSDETLFQDIHDSATGLSIEEKLKKYGERNISRLTVPYWEIYYSFHHPYFVGFLLFRMILQITPKFYLGLVNFSFKRLLLLEFLTLTTLTDFNFNLLRNKTENWLWTQMYWYRMYYINPIKLTSNAYCSVDNGTKSFVDNDVFFHKYYFMINFIFDFNLTYLNLSFEQLCFLIDFKWIYNHSYTTNWLTLDMPFSLNPFLILTQGPATNFASSILYFYWLHHLSFSWYNTLRQNFNFNLLFDWSSGTYLDTLNMLSYVGTYWGSSGIPAVFFENPIQLATSFLRFEEDMSMNFIDTHGKLTLNYHVNDLLISHHLAFHNFSILNFMEESISSLITFSSNFWFAKHSMSINFLKFYFLNPTGMDKTKYYSAGLFEIDSKIASSLVKKTSKIKELGFFYSFYWNFSYDFLILWLSINVLFLPWDKLILFTKALRFRLYSRYHNIKIFSKKMFLFKKRFF